MDARQQRGLEIAAVLKITQKKGGWSVPSQSGKGKYTVDHKNERCTCPDHENRGVKCKHIYAVEYVIQREFDFAAGTVTETQTVKVQETVQRTYPQNWRAYNQAQTSEKATFQVLLHDLCSGIVEPKAGGRGRPRIPLSDAIFSAVFKVYSTVSGRRFMSDLRDAHDKGYVHRLPSYNSIFNVLESEGTFDVLKGLVVESAQPLKALESNFACDSSGFSGCRFDRWIDHKYGDVKVKRAWVKAHIMAGVRTNVITAIEIHHHSTHDGTQLKPMLATTAENFNVKELSADLAYSTHANLEAVVDAGAKALIPFKRTASPAAGGLWRKLFHYFHLHREEFESRYHLRSNVETTFAMVKAKFGDSVRSKLDIAMKNEVLAKCVSHNICCLIQSMHEFGINPVFWADSSPAQEIAS